MKTKLIFSVILLTINFFLFTSSGMAQWELQYPIPTDKSIEDVCFVDDLNGWAVGRDGIIIHTEDGGATWDFQTSGTTLWLKSVTFNDTQTGWAVGRDYIILNTSDGGNTWNQQHSGNDADLNSVFFIDSLKGWVVGTSSNGPILHTDNGGIDWIPQEIGSPYIDCNEVFFTDSNNGWIASESGLYRTTNGGLDWVEQVNMDQFLSVFLINQNEGWASTRGFGYGFAYVLHTTDSFSTWDTIVESYAGDMNSCGHYSLHFKDQDCGWMLKYHCVSGGWGGSCSYSLMKTIDGGDNWESINIPTGIGLNALYFTTDGSGCIVGDHGIILQSNNWEDEWNMASQGNFLRFQSITFPDNNNGWAVGDGASSQYWWWVGNGSDILHTSDGGVNWETQNSGIPAPLKSVSFTDTQNGWAVGYLTYPGSLNTSYIIHTTNGGEDWVVQKQDTGYYLTEVCFVDELNGWVVGGFSDGYGYSEGKIFRTTDGGANWEQQYCDTCRALNSVFFSDPDNGWAVGSSIYNTIDGGVTWTEQAYDTAGFSLVSVYFLDTENGWIVGSGWAIGGIILQTSDGGNTWAYDFVDNHLLSVDFYDHNNGLISCLDGTILQTVDGGTNWEQLDSGTENALFSACYTNEGHAYVAGLWGTILHADDLVTSIEKLHDPEVTDVLQCFPNPFSHTTTLSYTLPQKSLVTLSVYNSNGQIVFVHEKFRPEGQHETIFNSTGLPPGIYFCVLHTNNEVQTIKMIKQ